MGNMKFCQVQSLCHLTMLRKTHRKTMVIVKFCQVLGTHRIKSIGHQDVLSIRGSSIAFGAPYF